MLPHERARGDEFVDGGAQGGAGDAEGRAEGALGRDRVAGAAGFDQTQEVLPYALPLQHPAGGVIVHAVPPFMPRPLLVSPQLVNW
ncbi:hypothetical protein AQF52_0559 [Streptomyces venezuelae]|nr:hypothetical protein AQF52_0559 [Streptomyces venezuelae]